MSIIVGESPWAAWRRQIPLTQAQLAEKVGVEPSMIAHIECGRRAPRVPLLVRICDELRLTDEQRLEALRLAAAQSSSPLAPEAAAS